MFSDKYSKRSIDSLWCNHWNIWEFWGQVNNQRQHFHSARQTGRCPSVSSSSISSSEATMHPSSCPRRRTYPWRNAADVSTVWPSVTVTNPTTPLSSASTSMQPAAAVCGTTPLAGALTLSPGTQSPTSWLPVCTKPPRDTFPATGSVLTTATVIPTMKNRSTS